MAMPALVADWTIDMLDALPDDGQRYELIDGVLHVTPSPNDVWRGERRRNLVQPDVYVVKRSGAADPGEVLSTTLRWHPHGMVTSFVLDLPSFFDNAFR